MKKFLMILAAMFVVVNMDAQVYVGGSLGVNSFTSQKNAGDKNETVFSFLPEIGYNINDEWAVGTVIGYVSDKWQGVEGISESAFTFNPYARYTFLKAGKVNMFVDGGIDFTSASDTDWTSIGVGFKPGLAVNLTDNISFVTHLGFIGWQELNPEGEDNNITKVGVDLNGSNLSFGLYFNF